MGESDGSPIKRFSLGGLSSLSENSLSPAVSNIVTNLVDQAFNDLTSGGDGPACPLKAAILTESSRKSDGDASLSQAPHNLKCQTFCSVPSKPPTSVGDSKKDNSECSIKPSVELSAPPNSVAGSNKSLLERESELTAPPNSIAGSNKSILEERESEIDVQSQSVMTSDQDIIIDSEAVVLASTALAVATMDTYREESTTTQYKKVEPSGLLMIPEMEPQFSESAQVLVPVHSVTEESEIPGKSSESDSSVMKHVLPIEESEMGIDGLEIKRNQGSFELEAMVADSSIRNIEKEMSFVTGPFEITESVYGSGGAGEMPEPVDNVFEDDNTPDLSGGAEKLSSSQEFKILVDKKAAQVAEMALEGLSACHSGGILQETYKKFSDVAKTAARLAAENSRKRRNGSCEENRRLPPEVREHVLRTLSDIKAQMDNLRSQLRIRRSQ